MATQHEIVGEEWKSRASELADWAMQRLVNRKDVWGQYSVLSPSEQREAGRSYKAMTLPRKDMRGDDMVTLDKLTRHFSSRHHRKPQIIGLHAKSKEDTSLWFGIDIDCHDTESTQAEDHARRNLVGAIHRRHPLVEGLARARLRSAVVRFKWRGRLPHLGSVRSTSSHRRRLRDGEGHRGGLVTTDSVTTKFVRIRQSLSPTPTSTIGPWRVDR